MGPNRHDTSWAGPWPQRAELPRTVLDAVTVRKALQQDGMVRDAIATDPINLGEKGYCDDRDRVGYPVQFINCELTSLAAPCVSMKHPVLLEDSLIHEFEFFATYVLTGFRMSRCHCDGAVTFSSGGHNQNATAFTLEQCRFDELVDFEDCWFEGPVRIRDCVFVKGANLFGNLGSPVSVTFDVSPICERNTGQLDVDTFEAT